MEETLKPEDLMVDDIVLAEATWYDEETGDERVEWHPFRVTDISSKSLLYCDDIEEGSIIGDWVDDCDAEEMRELKGMPLTEEILKANGFRESTIEECSYLFPEEYKDLNERGFAIDTDCNGVYYITDHSLMPFTSVHEFQKVLRSAKLNKLANNFKVKKQ